MSYCIKLYTHSPTECMFHACQLMVLHHKLRDAICAVLFLIDIDVREFISLLENQTLLNLALTKQITVVNK